MFIAGIVYQQKIQKIIGICRQWVFAESGKKHKPYISDALQVHQKLLKYQALYLYFTPAYRQRGPALIVSFNI
jgi:hypothetical protein